MPHRLMKLPLDSSHLDMPLNVIVAVGGSVMALALAVATWQFLGDLVAQIPTPDQVTGWQEREIYLCTAIIFAIAIAWMARWIAVKMLASQADNTAALKAVAASLVQWDKTMADMVTPAVKHALDEAFQPDQPRPMSSHRKRDG